MTVAIDEAACDRCDNIPDPAIVESFIREAKHDDPGEFLCESCMGCGDCGTNGDVRIVTFGLSWHALCPRCGDIGGAGDVA